MKKEKQIVNSKQFGLMIERLAHQLIENHSDFTETILVGLQPRGVEFTHRIVDKLNEISNNYVKIDELIIGGENSDWSIEEHEDLVFKN